MPRVYISDTNIWIDFRNAGLLNELFSLSFTLCCTDFVMGEFDDLPKEQLIAQGLQIETLGEAEVARLFALTNEHRNSSLADVSCYLLAINTGNPLLTGDGKLRKQAVRDGIEVYGALWLLDQLVLEEIVASTRAAQGLEAMLDQGARLPNAECAERLHRWK